MGAQPCLPGICAGETKTPEMLGLGTSQMRNFGTDFNLSGKLVRAVAGGALPCV